MNLAPKFTALCRHLLLQDGASPRGARTVLFSAFGNQISGFNLNQQHLFDSVIRHPLAVTLNRDTASAKIEMPALQPGVSILLPWQQPMYRLIFSLGTVSDSSIKGYPGYGHSPATHISPWYMAKEAVAASTVTLELNTKINGDRCMVVAVGIEMGTVVTDSLVQWVKYTGCAKILLAE